MLGSGTSTRAGRRRAVRGLLVVAALSGPASAASTRARPAPAPAAGAPGELRPGRFLSPLVPLQRLQGVNGHLHIDEVRLREDDRLLQASYTFGVVDTANPAKMKYLAQDLRHAIPDDERRPGAVHLAWDGDVAYTSHRGNIRNPAFLSGWDLRDPEAPRQLPVLQEPDTSYEGLDVSGGVLYAGLHAQGLGAYRRGEDGTLTRVGTATGFTNAWGVCARGPVVYVADGPGGLVTVDVRDPRHPQVLGRVATGGLATGVVVDGTTAYVAAGSAGLVVVDVRDPAAPTILGRAAMPGTAVRVAYSEGHAFVAAWNDARVYDVADPAHPRFVAAVRLTQRDHDIDDGDRPESTSRILGIAARGRDVFVGNWHVLYSFRLHPERQAPSIRLPEKAALLDFGAVPVGTQRHEPFEVTNQGTAPLTIVDAWVAGDGFSVTPRQVRIPPGGRATLTLGFAPGSAAPAKGTLQLLSDDPLAPRRAAYLVGNEPGLGVGSRLPETAGLTLDGKPWSSGTTQGQVLLLSYFATF